MFGNRVTSMTSSPVVLVWWRVIRKGDLYNCLPSRNCHTSRFISGRGGGSGGGEDGGDEEEELHPICYLKHYTARIKEKLSTIYDFDSV